MDWLIATPQLHNIFSNLGSMQGDTYVINPNALGIYLSVLFGQHFFFLLSLLPLYHGISLYFCSHSQGYQL